MGSLPDLGVTGQLVGCGDVLHLNSVREIPVKLLNHHCHGTLGGWVCGNRYNREMDVVLYQLLLSSRLVL